MSHNASARTLQRLTQNPVWKLVQNSQSWGRTWFKRGGSETLTASRLLLQYCNICVTCISRYSKWRWRRLGAPLLWTAVQKLPTCRDHAVSVRPLRITLLPVSCVFRPTGSDGDRPGRGHACPDGRHGGGRKETRQEVAQGSSIRRSHQSVSVHEHKGFHVTRVFLPPHHRPISSLPAVPTLT